MAWASLIVAGLVGALGVSMIRKLRYSRNLESITLIMIVFWVGFGLLAYAIDHMPMGSAF